MIDARGYACPMPVVMVQKEIKAHNPDSLEVMVDNQCSVENVTRFAAGRGYQVAVEAKGQDFLLKLTR